MMKERLFELILRTPLAKQVEEDYERELDAKRQALRRDLGDLHTTRERERPAARSKRDRLWDRYVKAHTALTQATREAAEAELAMSTIERRYSMGAREIEQQARAIADPRLIEFVAWCRQEHARVSAGKPEQQLVETGAYDAWNCRNVTAYVTNDHARVLYMRALLEALREAEQTADIVLMTRAELTAWIADRHHEFNEHRAYTRVAIARVEAGLQARATKQGDAA